MGVGQCPEPATLLCTRSAYRTLVQRGSSHRRGAQRPAGHQPRVRHQHQSNGRTSRRVRWEGAYRCRRDPEAVLSGSLCALDWSSLAGSGRSRLMAHHFAALGLMLTSGLGASVEVSCRNPTPVCDTNEPELSSTCDAVPSHGPPDLMFGTGCEYIAIDYWESALAHLVRASRPHVRGP